MHTIPYGYTRNSLGAALVPNPGKHEPKAGDWRTTRTFVVKDATGKTLKGPNGGPRRVPVVSDGEVLVDKLTMRYVKNTSHHIDNPLSGGADRFKADRDPTLPVWNPNADKRMAQAHRLAVLYVQGYLRLEDVSSARLRRKVKGIAGAILRGEA